MRLSSSDCHRRTKSGAPVPLQRVPASDRHGFPFRCDMSQRASAARLRPEGLRARRRQRVPHSISFLPKLRYHPLLGRGSQPGGLWSRSGCVRHVGISTAQRLDLGGVEASVAWPTAEDGTPSAGPTTGYMRAESNCSITMNSISRSDCHKIFSK